MPARDCSNDAGNGVVAVRNRLHFSVLAPRGVVGPACGLAPMRGRSGAAGSAVRGRSTCLSRRTFCNPGPFRCGHPLALPLPRPVDHVRKMACQLGERAGSGEPVAIATVLQPACNSQHVVFAVVSMAVARLHTLPSRHAHACVRERTHARTCTREVATLQPHNITYKYHMLVGCSSVAPRLHAQPAYFCRRIGADRACVGNILAGGNDGAVRQVLPSTVMQGRPRETFGVFAGRSSAGRSIDGAAVPIGPGARTATWLGRNGGFLPFSWGASAHVGMVMLEWCMQDIGFACISSIAHQPVRLRRKAIRADGHGARADCREGRPGRDWGLPTPLAPISGRLPLLHVGGAAWPNLDRRLAASAPITLRTSCGARPELVCEARVGVGVSSRIGNARTGRGWGHVVARCQVLNGSVGGDHVN